MKIIMSLLWCGLIFSGCSSNSKYKSQHNSFGILSIYDAADRKLKVGTIDLGIPVLTEEYIKSGQINKDPRISCFQSSESVNYINVLDYQLPLMRDYVLGKDQFVNFEKKEQIINGMYGVSYKEEAQRNLRIQFKECVIEIDGVNMVVKSEIYNKN